MTMQVDKESYFEFVRRALMANCEIDFIHIDDLLVSKIQPEAFRDFGLVHSLVGPYFVPCIAKYVPFECFNIEELVDLVHATHQFGPDVLYKILECVPSLKISKEFAMKVFVEFKFEDYGQGAALSFFGALNKDREVAHAAIQCGSSLKYADKILKFDEDEEIVLSAVKKNVKNFDHAHPKMQTNKKVLLAALQNQYVELYEKMPEYLKQDPEIIAMLVHNDNLATHFYKIPAWAQEDKNILKMREEAIFHRCVQHTASIAIESLSKRKWQQDKETDECGAKRPCK